MDLEINNICNELLKNVYKALKQYARFTEFLRFCDPGIRHYIRNYGEEAQDLIYNYKWFRQHHQKFHNPITWINLGMHVIDWLSYKLDDEYMDASLDETMNVNIKKLHALVTKIHHLYFQFACAQIKSSSDDKQE